MLFNIYHGGHGNGWSGSIENIKLKRLLMYFTGIFTSLQKTKKEHLSLVSTAFRIFGKTAGSIRRCRYIALFAVNSGVSEFKKFVRSPPSILYTSVLLYSTYNNFVVLYV